MLPAARQQYALTMVGDSKIRAPSVPSGWQKTRRIGFGESMRAAMMQKPKTR
ncbi:hypothetical protein [Xanthomonas translucens]|uniref:hypothetical protein n=1 Tax=Xanthomonas campestris pv. translucens TaxID=343 RepID=UPI000A9C1B13|nr:hypothetical protein [Xanthomonas translucens]QSQ56163.1 hypothetical protein ISN37_17645 [Xanthomonas translucens pv. undulosa]